MLRPRGAGVTRKLVLAGIIAVLCVAAATQTANDTIRYYLIVNGDSMSGSWDSREEAGFNGLRARFGEHFAWFRQADHEYVVTDAAVLAELDKAMEPQKNVNRMQAEVNRQQARVNGLQAKVNAHQNDVNALQNEVNRRQQLVNQIQAAVDRGDNGDLIQKLEAELKELRSSKPEANQANVNRMQAQVNQEQAEVNAQQSKVNAAQQPVNEEQHRVSAEFGRRVQEIFHSALQHGAAQQLK